MENYTEIEKEQFADLHVGHDIRLEVVPIVAISDEFDGNGGDVVNNVPSKKQLHCLECRSYSQAFISDVPQSRVLF